MNALSHKTLLNLGVTALARAGATSWFDGHFGGAALTAASLLERQHLTEEVKTGIRDQTSRAIQTRAELFVPFPVEAAQPDLEEKLLAALKLNLQRLRLSGHGVIYGTLALRALRADPSLMQPSIIEGLVALLHRTLEDRPNRYYGIADYRTVDIEGVAPYETDRDLIRASFVEVGEVYRDGQADGAFYYFAAEKLHAFTHAHALVTLSDLGYVELARLGWTSHRRQLKLNRMVPPNPEQKRADVSVGLTPYDEAYWKRDHFDDHALKLACAGLELLDKFSPAEQAEFYRPKTFWGPFMR